VTFFKLLCSFAISVSKIIHIYKTIYMQ
jgi:hypothetical protein